MVLPQPDGPSRVKNSLTMMVSETSSSALTALGPVPKALVTPCISTSLVPASARGAVPAASRGAGLVAALSELARECGSASRPRAKVCIPPVTSNGFADRPPRRSPRNHGRAAIPQSSCRDCRGRRGHCKQDFFGRAGVSAGRLIKNRSFDQNRPQP